MGIGTIIVVSVLTFFVLGGLRRAFWFRMARGRGWHGGYGWHGGHGRGFGRGDGPGGWFLERFLEELGANEEQKGKVRSIRERLVDGFRDLRSARRQLVERALDRMAQENLETAELDAALEEVVGKARANVKQAFVDLHATLTPEQRRRAVELARRRLAYFHG